VSIQDLLSFWGVGAGAGGGGREDFTTLLVIPATYTLWRQQTMNQLKF